MKKYLLLVLGCLTLSFNLTLAQSHITKDGFVPRGLMPSEALPDDYVLVRATNSLPKFDLDFRGGAPKDLVKAIEKATGKPLNTVIPDEYADLKISPISVKNVTVAQLFEVLTQASKKPERFTVLDPRDRSIGGNGSDVYEYQSTYGFRTEGVPTENSIWYFYWDKGGPHEPWEVLSSKVCKFYQLEPYLNAGYSVEDITTAVKTGWDMLGVDKTNQPEISYHKDTKVLIAVGDEDKVNLIGDVLKQLSTTPKEKSNDKDTDKSKSQ
jgi:hypothetical protein